MTSTTTFIITFIIMFIMTFISEAYPWCLASELQCGNLPRSLAAAWRWVVFAKVSERVLEELRTIASVSSKSLVQCD